MSRHYQFFLLAVLVAVVSAGCRTKLTEMTGTPEVQRTGILGLQLRTTQELILLKDRPAHTLYVLTIPDLPSSEQDNWGKQVGVLEAGTQLQINQAVRVTEPAWVVPWLPGYYTWNCALARVENGPFAGKEVAIAGEGIGPGAVGLGSSRLRPVDQASMISAFYNMPPYFRLPAPEKYDFYDSRSNLFATVTLVLSGHDFFGKDDGMWFGSLARSYVRPKSDQILASDKLNVHDLHRLTVGIGARVPIPSRFFPEQISLYPDEPNDQITLFMPLSETNGPVKGVWIHETDAGEVESGAVAGPIY